MRIIILKNPQAVDDTWRGQTILAGQTHTIQDEVERQGFASDAKLNQDLWAATPKLVVNDGVNDLSPEDGDKWLKGILDKFDEYGYKVIAPTFRNNQGLQTLWDGKFYTATAGQLNIFDEEITSELKAQGGWYEIVCDPSNPSAAIGDYVEFAMVDKNDVLGLFSVYGLTVGQDVLELGKFVKTEYVNPWACNNRQVFVSDSAFDVAAGLFFRTYYNSTGNINVDFKVDFDDQISS